LKIIFFVGVEIQNIYLNIYNTLCSQFEDVQIISNCSYEKITDILLSLNNDDLAIFADYYFFEFSRIDFEHLMRECLCKKIGIGFDDEYLLPSSLYLSSFMNGWFTFDLLTYEYMRQLGMNVFINPHPVYVEDDNLEPFEYIYDVAFIGNVSNFKKDRKTLLELIAKAYPNNFIPGLSGQYLSFSEMNNAVRKSRINLNLTTISSTNPYKINLPYFDIRYGFKGRPFEIGGLGGFCLSEYSPSIESFLKTKEHIDYFSNIEDALSKIKFYLDNNSVRTNISKNLYKWVTNNCGKNSVNNLFAKDIKNIISSDKYIFQKISNITPVYIFECKRAIYQFERKYFKQFFKTVRDILFIPRKREQHFFIIFIEIIFEIIINKIKSYFSKKKFK
jgi:hypothetical protein